MFRITSKTKNSFFENLFKKGQSVHRYLKAALFDVELRVCFKFLSFIILRKSVKSSKPFANFLTRR